MTTYLLYAALRDNRGMKDIDVSRGTGIPQSTFSDWKSGKSSPKVPKLLKIAEFFDVSIDELIAKETQVN